MFSVYFEVARLTENASVLEETFQNTKKRLTRAQYAFEYGQTNKLEVLNAEVDIVSDSINLMLESKQYAYFARFMARRQSNNLTKESEEMPFCLPGFPNSKYIFMYN